jgi:hypothetical protein
VSNLIWLLLAAVLAQVSTCASRNLHWPPERDALFSTQAGDIRHAVQVSDGHYVAVTGSKESWQPRTLVRTGPDGQERALALPTRDTSCEGESLVATEGEWWYSRCVAGGVQFVTSSASGTLSFVAVDSPDLDIQEWLPFAESPGGVLLSASRGNERLVVATRIVPGEPRETLGTFDRGSSIWGAQPGRALRLSADRIALVTVETHKNDPSHSSIVLRQFQNGTVATAGVAYHERAWGPFDAAIGPDGTVAIVAAPFDLSGIVAFVLDAERPEEALQHRLSSSSSAAGYWPGVKLVHGQGRFIASWIDEKKGHVHVAEFDREVVLPTAVVADTSLDSSSLSLGYVPDEGSPSVLVFWAEGNSLFVRRLAAPPTGSLLASQIYRRAIERIAKFSDR